MPNLPLLRSRNTFLGVAKETTQGTAVAPTLFVPFTSIKPNDVPQYVHDDAMANNPGKVRGIYQGELDSTFDFDGYLYPEVIGTLLVSAGYQDAVTGTAGTKVGTIAAAAAGATSLTYTLTSGAAPVATDKFQLDTGALAEIVTVSAVTGTGPYTLTVGPTTYAHANAAAANNVTGTSFTHTFKVPAAGTQPPSLTLTHWNAVTARQYPGSVLDTLTVTVDAKGAIKYAAKFKGWPSTTTTKPTPAFPTSAALLGWENVLSIGGSTNPKLVTGSVELKSNTESIHTAQGSQSPFNVFSGELEADFKLKLLFADEVDWLHIRNNDQPTLSLVVTAPSGSPAPVLTVSCNVAAWTKAPLDLSSKYERIDAELTGVTNTTDGGPVSFTLVNGASATY